MSKKNFIRAVVLTLLLSGISAQAGDELAKNFVTPPDEAKPWVNMFWIGRITTNNITQHMEELRAKGAGGAMLIDLNAAADASYMSGNWRELFKHSVREADRLGLKIGVNTCPGWPCGGKWITPELAAWMMVNSETVIKGPQKFTGKLTEPKGKGTLYADVSIQVFSISKEPAHPKSVLTVSSNPDDVQRLLDGNFNTQWKPGKSDEKPWIMVDFGKAHGVDWLWLDMSGQVVIEASDDGVAFKPVATLVGTGGNTIYLAMPATTARWFRMAVPKEATVRDLALGSKAEVERVARMAAKRGTTHPLGVTDTRQIDQVNLVREDLVSLPDDQPLQVKDRIDLTAKVSEDGTLNWDVPDGTWKVVRIGRTTTGQKLAFGDGLVTDYLNPAAMDKHYEHGIKPLLGDAGALVGKTWQYSIEDNFEADLMYSWTPKMLEEFKTRRNYDATPYLAALAGELVESVEITDRFLADVRRTIADCAADQHYGRWAERAHADGLKVRAEAGGQHHPRLYFNDGLMNQGRVDVPVAEFWEIELWKENQGTPADHNTVTTPGWMDGAQNVNAKQAASAGHLYGKKMVASEAFTSGGRRARWGTAPSDLLMHANTAFCEGINALSIHGSATSGPENGLPGKSVFGGIHFSHNQTWWNQGAEGLLRYLSRCCTILRQGLFVADVLYYSGDEVPNFIPPKNIDPARGFGYDYDVCNTEIMLTRLSVKDKRIMLPDGMSYGVLVLPDRPVLPLAVAKKIEELVAAGATIIGPKPLRTPGLTGYPESEKELKKIADKLWGTQANLPSMQRAYGKGRVICGMSIRDVLAKDNVPVDFAFQSTATNAGVDFIHRRTDDTDIYFVANRHGAALKAECTFRVSGMQPELWDPVTGTQRALPQFEVKDGRTSIPLEFEPYGGMFIIFKRSQKSESRSQNRNGTNFPELKPVQEITGAWTVQFDPKWFYPTNGLTGDPAKGLLVFDKLADWRTRPESAAKNFSGTAIYKKTFELSQVSGFKFPVSNYYLDMGTVKETARVTLNGKDLGVLWCSPWRVDITGALKTGENTLEISVVNLWPNRLVGDNGLSGEDRRTRTEMFFGGPDYQFSSGLLGPVTIQAAQPTLTKEVSGAGAQGTVKSASDALPRPTAEQALWQDYEIGVFYHYDLNAFKPGWDHRQYDNFPKADIFNPTNLNVQQWMEVPKALGAKYAILTATHGSGFMLWQSEAYPFGVRQSPWRGGKGDVVKDFVETCRKNGVSPGLYCHMRVNGWWQVDHPGFVNRGKGGDDALQAKYAAAKIQQVKELWGKYGPLAEIWIDGGLPDPKAGFDLRPYAKELQPKAMVYGANNCPWTTIRWTGGESGMTKYPNWATGTWPCDDQPGSPDGKDWLPAEADVNPVEGDWMWQPGSDSRLFSVDRLMEIYYGSVGNNCNLLINATPGPDGLIPEAQIKRYREFGAEIQRRFGKSLAETTGQGNTLELPFVKPTKIDHLMLMEQITEGERVREYVVEGKVNDQWQKIGGGSCIGHKRIERIKSVEVTAVRLNVLKSVGTPVIRKFAVFNTSAPASN